jgi:acyl-ACP thioesterase
MNVSTEVSGFRRVWARRRSEVRRGAGGPLLATALIDWVLLDAQGRPSRIPNEILGAFDVPPPNSATPLRVRLSPPPPGAARREFAARRSELDPLAHVNNAAYLDYLDEQIARTGDSDRLARLPRAYEVEFVVPAEPQAPLVGSLWRNDGGWSYRLESGAGQELLRAKMRS